MTYTKTHALILNHNNHITITDLKIFKNSYNRFTYIIILVTNLCLYIKSYTYGRLILIPISRRMHTYIDFLVCDTELIHILILVSRMTYTYTYLPYDIYLYLSPVGHILIPISRRTHTYTNSDFLIYGTELIHILRQRYLSRSHTSIYLILVQIFRRSYRVYAYTEILIHVLVLISILDLP